MDLKSNPFGQFSHRPHASALSLDVSPTTSPRDTAAPSSPPRNPKPNKRTACSTPSEPKIARTSTPHALINKWTRIVTHTRVTLPQKSARALSTFLVSHWQGVLPCLLTALAAKSV